MHLAGAGDDELDASQADAVVGQKGERERLIFRTLCAYGAIALDNARAYRQVAATQQQLLEKNLELEQAYKALEEVSLTDQLTGLRNRRFFLQNTATNLAGAELQELVKSAIESNGGRITTSQNTSPRDDGRFREIGVNVQFFASTPNLQKILLAIETHVPYLIVEGITVRPLNAFRGFKPAPGQEPELNVQLDVGAWAYQEPARAAAAQAVSAP